MNRGTSAKHHKFNEKHIDSNGKIGDLSKGDTISSSMSRMIRSSPKIHLKQHIASHASIINQTKNSSVSKNFHNKLYINRLSLEKTMQNVESSRNTKLEKMNNKHMLNPIRTTSNHGGRGI